MNMTFTTWSLFLVPPSSRETAHRIGHEQLRSSNLSFVPFGKTFGRREAIYRAYEFTGTVVEANRWVFFGQLTKELLTHQLAALIMDLLSVEPLLIVKKNQCMHMLLRSENEASMALSFNGRLLLDFEGVWFADAHADINLIRAETADHRIPFLPRAPVTVERCSKPPISFSRGAIGPRGGSPASPPAPLAP